MPAAPDINALRRALDDARLAFANTDALVAAARARRAPEGEFIKLLSDLENARLRVQNAEVNVATAISAPSPRVAATQEDLNKETNARFWAQTGYKVGQKLDIRVAKDKEMAKVWNQIMGQVKAENAKGELVLTYKHPAVQQNLADASVATHAADHHTAAAQTATTAQAAAQNAAIAAAAHEIAHNRAAQAAAHQVQTYVTRPPQVLTAPASKSPRAQADAQAWAPAPQAPVAPQAATDLPAPAANPLATSAPAAEPAKRWKTALAIGAGLLGLGGLGWAIASSSRDSGSTRRYRRR